MSKTARTIIFLVYLIGLTGLEWGAAFSGSRFMRKHWMLAYKLLVALSWMTVVVEMTGFLLLVRHLPNHGMYNVWSIVETGILFYIQYLTAVSRWAKRVLVISLAILLVGGAIFYIKWPKVIDTSLQLELFTLFVQLVATCAALIDILQNMSDKLLSAQPAFWLNIGMLFYICIFILIHILGIYSKASASQVFYFFSLAANFFMYSGFIACFRTLRRQDSKVLLE
jgi:hypothetical protein